MMIHAADGSLFQYISALAVLGHWLKNWGNGGFTKVGGIVSFNYHPMLMAIGA